MLQPNSRLMCNTMLEEVGGLECDNDLLLQSRTQHADSGFCVDMDLVKGAFIYAIM
jgi:hypothetical protein